VPLPTVTEIDPPRPAVAAPVPIQICPELPLLDEPELKIKTPDTPDKPAFAVRIVTVPLVKVVPSPLDRLNAPPVWAMLRPETISIPPPAPLVPLPTERRSSPPLPPVTAPEPM